MQERRKHCRYFVLKTTMELKILQLKTSSSRAFSEAGVPGEILVHKLDEVKESVQVRTSIFLSYLFCLEKGTC